VGWGQSYFYGLPDNGVVVTWHLLNPSFRDLRGLRPGAKKQKEIKRKKTKTNKSRAKCAIYGAKSLFSVQLM